MKSRVTLIVTLVSLVALALLFAYNCSKLADESNADIERELYVACSLTGEFSKTDSVERRVQTLSQLKSSQETVRALYDRDGSALFTSHESYGTLSDDAMARAKTGEAVLKRYRRSDGREAVYAIYRYEDGAFLLYAAALFNVFHPQRYYKRRYAYHCNGYCKIYPRHGGGYAEFIIGVHYLADSG